MFFSKSKTAWAYPSSRLRKYRNSEIFGPLANTCIPGTEKPPSLRISETFCAFSFCPEFLICIYTQEGRVTLIFEGLGSNASSNSFILANRTSFSTPVMFSCSDWTTSCSFSCSFLSYSACTIFKYSLHLSLNILDLVTFEKYWIIKGSANLILRRLSENYSSR